MVAWSGTVPRYDPYPRGRLDPRRFHRAGSQLAEHAQRRQHLLPSLWSAGVRKDETGVLTVAGLSVVEIADQVGTPVYVVDEADLRARARARRCLPGLGCLLRRQVLPLYDGGPVGEREGLGVDVCTGGELAVVQRAGLDLRRVGLHGNNKSVEELRVALTIGVGRIIVDSFDEIARLSELAEELQIRPRVMVRATTGVEAHTHEYIATAHEDQKFGFSIADGSAAVGAAGLPPALLARSDRYPLPHRLADLRRRGVSRSRHGVPSGCTPISQLRPASSWASSTLVAASASPTPVPTHHPRPLRWRKLFERSLPTNAQLSTSAFPHLSLEPGRAISGPSTFALYRVGTVKPVALDGGASPSLRRSRRRDE